MKRILAGLVLGAAAALAAAPASAQVGRDGGPIQITADNLEALTDAGRYTWTGNVDAVQQNSRLRTRKLTMNCTRGEAAPNASAADRAAQGCAEIRNFVAEGDVYYITAEEKIKGDRAEYDYTTDTITLTGNVILTRADEGVVKGGKIVYEVGAGRVLITPNSGERVTSLFTQTNRARPAPGATPATPAPTPPSNPQ